MSCSVPEDMCGICPNLVEPDNRLCSGCKRDWLVSCSLDRIWRGVGLVYAERYSQESYIKQFWDKDQRP